MYKTTLFSSFVLAFVSVHGNPMVADPGTVSTTIPLHHIVKSDVEQRHPETGVPDQKSRLGCDPDKYPCSSSSATTSKKM